MGNAGIVDPRDKTFRIISLVRLGDAASVGLGNQVAETDSAQLAIICMKLSMYYWDGLDCVDRNRSQRLTWRWLKYVIVVA